MLWLPGSRSGTVWQTVNTLFCHNRHLLALQVSIRTNSVIGAAMEYNLYQNHVQQQLEASQVCFSSSASSNANPPAVERRLPQFNRDEAIAHLFACPQVKKAQEAALEADVEQRQKGRLTTQDSIARRVAKVTLDEAKWRRHQVSDL
jgi:hypothetical protein